MPSANLEHLNPKWIVTKQDPEMDRKDNPNPNPSARDQLEYGGPSLVHLRIRVTEIKIGFGADPSSWRMVERGFERQTWAAESLRDFRYSPRTPPYVART